MSVEIDCKTLNRARDLAANKGLDPDRVVCDGCLDGTDCVYSDGSGMILPEDLFEEKVLERLEGANIVDRFYRKIEEYFRKNGKTPKSHQTD